MMPDHSVAGLPCFLTLMNHSNIYTKKGPKYSAASLHFHMKIDGLRLPPASLSSSPLTRDPATHPSANQTIRLLFKKVFLVHGQFVAHTFCDDKTSCTKHGRRENQNLRPCQKLQVGSNLRWCQNKLGFLGQKLTNFCAFQRETPQLWRERIC